jgi:NAD(P)H-binding
MTRLLLGAVERTTLSGYYRAISRILMKLSVFGGLWGTGLKLIERALGEGHEITALARRPGMLKERFPQVRFLVKGDAFDSKSVMMTVSGADAVVVSTLGFVGRPKGPTHIPKGCSISLMRCKSSVPAASS